MNKASLHIKWSDHHEKQLSLSLLLDHNETDPVLSDTGCGEKKRRNHTSNAVN